MSILDVIILKQELEFVEFEEVDYQIEIIYELQNFDVQE